MHYICATKEEAHPVKSNRWSIILLDRPGQKNQRSKTEPKQTENLVLGSFGCPVLKTGHFFSLEQKPDIISGTQFLCSGNRYDRIGNGPLESAQCPRRLDHRPASHISARSFTGTLENSDSKST